MSEVSQNVQRDPAPWQEGTCNTPMWLWGAPSGLCGEKSHGHQLPSRFLMETRYLTRQTIPFCRGHACVAHGGPREDEPRIFQDGTTEEGRPMWCAVMPDFIDLQVSPAGFDGNPVLAVARLRAAIARATGEQQ